MYFEIKMDKKMGVMTQKIPSMMLERLGWWDILGLMGDWEMNNI
jgi:hypothetical protein